MRISTSRSRESLFVWLFWTVGLYLVLELGPFLMAARALDKPAIELAGPYLAFAIPWAILAPLIWWLRKNEERDVEPKRLAQCWGASVAFFGVAIAIAVYYSGVELDLMNKMDAIGGLVVSVVLIAPILYFTLHYMALSHFSSKAYKERHDRPEDMNSR